MRSFDPSEDADLDATAKRVAGFASRQIGPTPPADAGADEFARRLAGFRQIRRNRKWFTVGVAAAVAVFLVGLAGSRLGNRTPTSGLSYRVDDREPPFGSYVLVSETAESLLAFSDGSKVRMSARTRGRVLEVDSRGAKFALEEGKVSVDIVRRPRTYWTFEAGPFLVTVHGTSFTVAWNRADALFEVVLKNGSVSVASPVGGPEIELHAGQTLRVSLRDQTSTVGTTSLGDGSGGTGSPVGTTRPTEPTLVAPRTMPPRPSESVRWSHRGWTTALADGKAADVVSDADRRGLTAVLEQADSEDLWALANAARYARRYPLARQALTAERRRFPKSDRARDAAFFLGRLQDGDSDGPGGALGWYDRYLAEASDGVHVSDALGRKMTLLQRWDRRGEALAVAQDYLRRFPHGTYANAARALVRAAAAAGP
jgi:hypothetical protein